MPPETSPGRRGGSGNLDQSPQFQQFLALPAYLHEEMFSQVLVAGVQSRAFFLERKTSSVHLTNFGFFFPFLELNVRPQMPHCVAEPLMPVAVGSGSVQPSHDIGPIAQRSRKSREHDRARSGPLGRRRGRRVVPTPQGCVRPRARNYP